MISLGGGRKQAGDVLDFAVGFEHPKKIGDYVKKGDPLIIMHFNDQNKAAEAEVLVLKAYNIQDQRVPKIPHLVTQRIA